jgi:hypothetical protein
MQRLSAQVPAPILPVNARVMHPGIAKPALGATYHEASPHMQIQDGSWNHGEGFNGTSSADYGGWFLNDNGSGVTSLDIHSPLEWQSATWVQPYLPGGATAPIEHMVGYLRPQDQATGQTWPLPAAHPLDPSSGPYVDQAAFELFRPAVPYNPAQHTHVVVILYNWETISFPANAAGKQLAWFQIYPGFFSPDGLIRRDDPALSFVNNNSYEAGVVQRPPGHSQIVREHNTTSTWYPVVGYIVPSVTKRQADLNEQRNMQLRQAVIELLGESTTRNPIGAANAFGPSDVVEKVVVIFSGGSNGGLQSGWSLLRYPDKIHGAFCSVINPSMQRMFGEHDLGYATGMLSGGSDPGAGIEGPDFMHWGRYAWNQGYWVHDLSYTRRFALGEAFRPACFMCGDEDITSTGTDWGGLAAGGTWAQFGTRYQASTDPLWPIGNEIGWAIAETACHGNVAEVHNPYAGGAATVHLGDLTRGVVEKAISFRQQEVYSSPTPTMTAPPARDRTSSLRGLDDPHEWALGRIGDAMPDHSADPLLRRDDDWFAAVQPGAAGTYLGQMEAMKIYDRKVYVVGAEGVVTSFEVDPNSSQRSLRKVAHSNDGTTTATGIVLPKSLGHDGAGLAIVAGSGGPSLIVSTRRHLHRLNPATLEILQSRELPWEVARPHHLTSGDVLPGRSKQLIFASMHGGLVFFGTDLTPIYEWPEPGIRDFIVQGDKVTILSSRGVVAEVSFVATLPSAPTLFEARLHAVSRPIPRQLTVPVPVPAATDPPTQGNPHDLELMRANLSAFGAGTITAPIALWSGDADNVAVRGYTLPGLSGVPFVSNAQTVWPGNGGLDIATCLEGTPVPGEDLPGDHLLLLQAGSLSLYNQVGILLGQKALALAGPSLDYYPPGYQAHSLAVGELADEIGEVGTYSQEVVVASQSGSLMWMHINELLGASTVLGLEFVPAAANQGAPATSVLPRSNQSMSATWAMTERDNGLDQLHLLDQRGGYWRVDPSGVPTYWDGDSAATQMRGWHDLGNLDANGDPLPLSQGAAFSSAEIQIGSPSLWDAQSIATKPWCPANVHQLANIVGPNWYRFPAGSTTFEGFLLHRWGGTLLDVAIGPDLKRDAYFWSARPLELNSIPGITGPWGNLAEAIRFPSPTGPWSVDGLWASTEYRSGTAAQAGLEFLDLRSFVSNVASMTHQAVEAAQMQGNQVHMILGCPGGKVRVVQPVMGTSPTTHHEIGSFLSQVEDLGFGGAALAIKVVNNTTIRVWFGTLYGATPEPAAYGQCSGALEDAEVATGGVHVLDYSSGLSLVNSRSLAPKLTTDRGGYGVVGMCLGDILPEDPGTPAVDELVVSTLAGDIFVLDSATLSTKWRTNVPGSAGYFNSLKISDLDGDGVKELYVAGSFGIWRFSKT